MTVGWFGYAWLDLAWATALVVLIPILVASVLQILRTARLSALAKTVWLAFVILAPVIGVIGWLLFKPSDQHGRTTEGTFHGN